MFKKLLLGTVFAICASTASAGVIEHSSGIDYIDTDFSNIVFNFQQFDDLGGTRTLDSINLTIFGEVLSTAQVENFSSNSGSVITILVSALLGLESSTGQTLVSTLPSLSRQFAASSFDGQADWAGTSGATFYDLYSNNSESALITDESVLSLFIGSGTIDTFLFGQADTRASGGGNVFSGFNTSAKASVDIQYNFSDIPEEAVDVPEPAGLGIMAAGLFGFVLSRRRNKANNA